LNTGFVRDINRNGYIDGGDLLGDATWTAGGDKDDNGYGADLIGWNFVGRNSRPNDYDIHGTHVAGTIAAMRNSRGHTGVAHDALIMPIASLGAFGGSGADVAAGIRYAADNGAHVINLSLGGGFSRAMEDAIVYATSRGSVVVAAAGNDAENEPGFPANLATMPGVISVGAVDRQGIIADFSHFAGLDPDMKHVMGPGVDIFSTVPGGLYENLSGTSMATPHVAGVVALMLSARGTTDPVGRDAVVDALVDTAIRKTSGRATVNRRALFAAIGSMPATVWTAAIGPEVNPPKARLAMLLRSVRS
jgi:subtilisin family serine protease